MQLSPQVVTKRDLVDDAALARVVAQAREAGRGARQLAVLPCWCGEGAGADVLRVRAALARLGGGLRDAWEDSETSGGGAAAAVVGVTLERLGGPHTPCKI